MCLYVRGKKFEKGGPPIPGHPNLFAFPGFGDLSNTQFAVLGLWVARKHHVPVDRSLLLAEARCRAAQASDGGWPYNALGTGWPGIGTSDAMTCSGMMELAVARAVSQPQGAKMETADPQFEKGIEYLAQLFDRGVPLERDRQAQAAQVQNLRAVARLRNSQAALTNPRVQDKPDLWKKALTVFQSELQRTLAQDLPADAKKDLQDVGDQIKKYEADPSEKEKKALEDLIQKTAVLQGKGPAGVGLNTGPARPGRILMPPKANRDNEDDIYCLWSVERLCMVCDLKTVAGRDWYAWGASLLVADQNDDGSWPSAGDCGPLVDTCLALLFLKRVNVAKDLTARLQLIAPIKDLPPEKLKYIGPADAPSLGRTQPKSPGETTPPPEDPVRVAPKP